MNIAIIADRLELGGLETHVVSCAQELSRRGHNVYVSANAISEFNLNALLSFSGITYIPWNDVSIVDNFAGIPIDIVHGHPFTAVFRSYELAVSRNIPLILSYHGNYDFGIDRSELGLKVQNKAYKIICVDERVERFLIDNTLIPQSKFKLIYNGIDMNTFKPDPKYRDIVTEELGINLNYDTITILSRLDSDKGPTYYQFMDIFPEITHLLGGLNVLIIGEGSHMEEVWNRNQVEIDNTLNLNVYRLGVKRDVEKYLNVSDLTLACGRAAIEAMACGSPVFNVSGVGVSDLVTPDNYRNTLYIMNLYRHWDNQYLVDRITGFLKNKWYRGIISEEGVKIVNRHSSLENNTAILEALYKQALGEC